MKGIHFISIFILLLLSIFKGSYAGEHKPLNFIIKGYVKDLQTVNFDKDGELITTNNLIHNRINFKWNIADYFHARIDLRNRIYYGDQLNTNLTFGKYIASDQGFLDLGVLWVNSETLVITTIPDRLLVSYATQKIAITVGRQRINWGVNTVWNPNDLFNAYNFLDFDYEERPGSDAVRIQHFPGTLTELEMAYKPSRNKNGHVAAVRFKMNKCKYDMQLLGGLYNNDIAMGAGWAGNISDAGFKGEITWFRNKNDFLKGKDDITGAVVFDYSLKNNWYIMASALYVRNPSPLLYQVIIPVETSLSAKSLMPYPYTFYAGATKSFNPVFTGNMAIIYAPQNNSTIIYPGIAYNVEQNFDLDMSAQFFFSDQWGKFENNGNTVFIRIRWSY